MLTFQAAGSGVLKYPASLQTLLQRSLNAKGEDSKDLAGEPRTPGELNPPSARGKYHSQERN